ncbi:hypothetical protein [Allohahella marinimesophila]
MQETTSSPVVAPRAAVSWGAIIAALAFVIAANWLLILFGSAIGISIADVSDAEAVSQGLGIGAIIWVVVSGIVTYFIAGYIAARLARSIEKGNGLLHGLTLWSTGVVVTLILASWGIGGVMSAGKSLVGGTISVGQATATGAGGALDQLQDSDVMQDIQGTIKTRAAEAIAQSEAGEELTQAEARQAMNEIDQDTFSRMARHLVMGNTEQARSALASSTNLSESEVESVVEGVSQGMSGELEQLKAEAEQVAETASTYAQAVTWAVFIAALLSLIAALIGGKVGSSAARSHFVENEARRHSAVSV